MEKVLILSFRHAELSHKIEENILFGKEMDREKYERVLEACSLKKDLEILSFGDQTVIGERGINLSSGQKQRIQIARALYQDVDIYLFDDPFCAVDAHTGSHLFRECILGLLSSKTIIYVTHQIEFLPIADLILKIHFSLICLKSASASGLMKKEEAKSEEPKMQLVQEEEREKGRVCFSVYWKYFTTAYGGALVPLILLAQVLFHGLQIRSNYWMALASLVLEDEKPLVSTDQSVVDLKISKQVSAFAFSCP
ncbi:probable non-intrinsic ABC protein 5 [Humulus lupulus]|uniref:probable non-intrinsic ABC protein 5 n=1 Tax=Humulus lupulus TaxID=3486 RepID=UPI002B40A32F|nr:probable non-intrinsic ABC protein 5 [Humulus lupulus]